MSGAADLPLWSKISLRIMSVGAYALYTVRTLSSEGGKEGAPSELLLSRSSALDRHLRAIVARFLDALVVMALARVFRESLGGYLPRGGNS